MRMPTRPGGPADVVAPGPAGGDRLARALTELLSPAVLVVVVVVLSAWHSATSVAQAWIAGALGVLTGSAIPLGYILRGVRRGHWTDHHVGVRAQRRWPLVVALGSGCVGTVLLWLAGARDVMAVGAAGMAALVVAIGVTVGLRWKVSIHAVAAAGVTAVLTVMFGPWLASTWPVALAIGWSRVRLGDHTAAQVAVGAIIGAVVMCPVYLLLR